MNKFISSAMMAAMLSVPVGAFAQELSGGYLGAAATGYFLDRDRFIDGEDDDATTLGINLGYRYDNPFAVEIGYSTESDLDVFKLDGYYYLNRSENGWAPYFVLGYTNFSFDDDAALVDSDDSSGQMDAGFGFSKTWKDSQWEFRGDGRFLEKMGSGDQATDLALTLGVNYYFTKAETPVAEPVAAPEPEPVPQTRTITVKLNVLFEFDSDVVKAIYGDELTAVAKAMQAHEDITLVLEGHTDSVGGDDYNQGLSQRRVDAVKSKLVADFSIPGDRISTVGYGESRPIADNSTDEGRALNRRVIGELTFTEAVAN